VPAVGKHPPDARGHGRVAPADSAAGIDGRSIIAVAKIPEGREQRQHGAESPGPAGQPEHVRADERHLGRARRGCRQQGPREIQADHRQILFPQPAQVAAVAAAEIQDRQGARIRKRRQIRQAPNAAPGLVVIAVGIEHGIERAEGHPVPGLSQEKAPERPSRFRFPAAGRGG